MCMIVCAQLLLFALNFLFWVFGGCVASFGIWLMVDPDFDNYADAAIKISSTFINLQHIAIVFIIIGLTIVFLGFVGCCGTLVKHPGLLYFFNLLSGALLIIEIVMIGMAIAYHNKVNSSLEKVFEKKLIEEYGKGNKFEKAVDKLQQKLKCCGFNGTENYKDSYWWNNTKAIGDYVPNSCCVAYDIDTTVDKIGKPTIEMCQTDAKGGVIKDVNVYSAGCYMKIRNWIIYNDVVFIALGFAISILQFFGLIAGCCLRRSLRNEKSEEIN